MKSPSCFLGIDVGTSSARAGFFTAQGQLIAAANHPIAMWKPANDFVEQSSDDIWEACCAATKQALQAGGIKPDSVMGIGFDATCSLVLLDKKDRPVSVSPTGHNKQNVIVWMDHRAIGEAREINNSRHPVLKYVGKVISPEMQAPKLLWIKRNLPEAWKKAARFLDLPDFLTYRATGDDTRSLCTTVCKWNYRGHRGTDAKGWDKSYFQKIGLGDLAEEGYQRIGQRVRPLGEALGHGLTGKAARELGLNPGTPVGVSIIDAHAGGLGMLAASVKETAVKPAHLQRRLAIIGGTSSCHMAVSTEPRFIRGIWGPYFSAMIPDFWLMEGGQSASGALIDHIIFSHPASATLLQEARQQGRTIYELLNERLNALREREGLRHEAELTRDLHVQPDFHGNRSPRANPSLKGTIAGLTLSATADDLARLYLAAIQAVAQGTRHILEEANKKGFAISEIFICGGGTKNPVFLQEHADILGCRLILPKEPEAVLLGASILGAVASGAFKTVMEAMKAMNSSGRVIEPSRGAVAKYHDRKYRVFHRMHTDFLAYRRLMETH